MAGSTSHNRRKADEMLIAVVQIPRSSPKPAKDAAVARGLESAPIYRDVKGLIRKDYLNGEGCGGGVYLFESREAAEEWFNDDWWGWIEERFGARPTLTFYDQYVTVDNAAGEVRVDGKAVDIGKGTEAAE
ncbi:MAG: monooxygenase [Pseudomonadota bacterium]